MTTEKPKQSDILLLKFLGRTIACVFENTSSLGNKKIIKDFIIKNYSGFIQECTTIIDLKIVFSGENAREIRHVRNRDVYFLILFKYESTRIIRTFQTISSYEFQLILREALFKVLSHEEVILLHASSNLINGKAYIYTGDSGSGKSTLAQLLSSKYPPLTDDSVFIKKEKGKFYVYQTPFFEKNNYDKKNINRYELGGILFLNKNRSFVLTHISDKSLLSTLMSKQLYVTKPYYRKHMQTMLRLVNEFGEFYSFRFNKEEKRVLRFVRANIPFIATK